MLCLLRIVFIAHLDYSTSLLPNNQNLNTLPVLVLFSLIKRFFVFLMFLSCKLHNVVQFCVCTKLFQCSDSSLHSLTERCYLCCYKEGLTGVMLLHREICRCCCHINLTGVMLLYREIYRYVAMQRLTGVMCLYRETYRCYVALQRALQVLCCHIEKLTGIMLLYRASDTVHNQYYFHPLPACFEKKCIAISSFIVTCSQGKMRFVVPFLNAGLVCFCFGEKRQLLLFHIIYPDDRNVKLVNFFFLNDFFFYNHEYQ